MCKIQAESRNDANRLRLGTSSEPRNTTGDVAHALPQPLAGILARERSKKRQSCAVGLGITRPKRSPPLDFVFSFHGPRRLVGRRPTQPPFPRPQQLTANPRKFRIRWIGRSSPPRCGRWSHDSSSAPATHTCHTAPRERESGGAGPPRDGIQGGCEPLSRLRVIGCRHPVWDLRGFP